MEALQETVVDKHPHFVPRKTRETSVLIVRALHLGEHFILLSLSTRPDTLLFRIDPVTGALCFDWRQGVHVFPSEVTAIESLRSFGDLDVRAKACAILGYASLNDTALVLLATRARAAVTLPGGHLILTVTESQWFRVPLQGNGEAMSRDEARKVDLLTDFPLDGAHFFCETADITRPFPSECSPTEPAWEWVWNRWLSEPFRSLGLHDACPNLQQFVGLRPEAVAQGMAEARQLTDVRGKSWVLTEISRRSRLHPGTRYLARGLNEQASAGNEIECEQLVWQLPCAADDLVRWSSFVWRRGSVPIWWGVEIKNSGVGEAEIWINASHTYRGSGTYFKRLQHRYVPRVTIAREVSPGRDKAGPASGASAAAVPVTCINLLRCAMGKSEMLLSEHFHEAVRRIRKSDQERQLMVLNFDWHSTVKSLGEVSAVEGLWSLLGSIQPQYDVSAGVMGPEKDIKASYPSATGSTSPWPDGWAVHWLRQQYGILRFNCADSLDRTNVASYFAATEALVEQAKVCGLNILGRPTRHLAQTSPTPGRSPSTGALSKVLPKSLAKSVDSMAARMSRAGLSAPKLSSIGAEPELQVQAEDNTSSADQLQSQQPLLPKGWESRKDPVTGRTFYIDHVNKVTTWTCPAPPPVVSRASEPPSRSADEDRSRATSLASDSDIDVSSMEMSQTPEWGLFGWTVEQVKAQMLPEVVSTHAELFLINGDLQAMFYTASRAMHSQLINLLEGKRARPRSSGMGVVTNAGLAVQRRFNNLVQDESRMAQLEVFLGLKMGQHFPSIRTPYTEPILPDDVSDSGEEEPSLMASAGPGPSTISAGAAARAERAANAAFLAATKPQQLRLLDEYSESPFSQSAVLPDSSLT